MTGKDADQRVLFINLGFFKFGTDNKVQAAAIFLSIILLIMIAGVLISAAGVDNAWNERVFAWLGGAFLFVAGVAVGRGGDRRSDD